MLKLPRTRPASLYRFPLVVALPCIVLLHAPPVLALPAGGQVSAGSGGISQSGNVLTVQQNTGKLAINWNSFSIGTGESVNFIQPGAQSIVLNRVLGQSPSSILGSMSANGQVFVINPNGVLFGAGAQVNVGALLASTLNLSDSDFLAGQYRFSGAGTGSVINQGTLNATNGGYLALLAPQVQNTGSMTAPDGSVALGAGSKMTLTLASNQSLGLTIEQGAVDALAANGGLIQADGGLVVLSARGQDAVLAGVVNNTGLVQARTVNNDKGVIRLLADGDVTVSGTLDASGNVGGDIRIGGRDITLAAATLDASGANGGGTILVGGDVHGGALEAGVANARDLYIDAASKIDVDATVNGNGGRAVLWADRTNVFKGVVSARGGALGGDGGFMEVSGKERLFFRGMAYSNAPYGKTGTLLLDPKNIVIATGGGDPAPGQTYGSGTDVTIDPTAITAILGANALVLQANNDITVNSAISMGVGGNPANSLTLSAGRSILINADIDVGDRNLFLYANDTAANGVNDLFRDAGAAVITMAPGTTLNTWTLFTFPSGGDLWIEMRDGAGRANNTSGNITLATTNTANLTVINNGPTAGSGIVLDDATLLSVLTGSSASLSATNGDIVVNNLDASTGNITVNAVNGNVQLGTGGASVIIADSDITVTAGGNVNTLGTVTTDIDMTVTAGGNIALGDTNVSNTLTAVAGGNITLNGTQGVGNQAILAAGQNFINNVGPAVLAGVNIWQVYSASPDNNVFGGLVSGAAATWGSTYPSAATTTGYFFSLQPVITITANPLTKNFGEAVTPTATFAGTVYNAAAYGNVFLQDAPITGLPAAFSAGSAAGAPASFTPYAITAALGSLVLPAGYAVNFVDSQMTVYGVVPTPPVVRDVIAADPLDERRDADGFSTPNAVKRISPWEPWILVRHIDSAGPVWPTAFACTPTSQ